jgi:endonuclease/exonuclease/phosphatase family metal-dependent hydrolase
VRGAGLGGSIHDAKATQLTGELRILHWNIHSWRDPSGAPNLDAVISLVHETSPDVISLVEVDEGWGMPAALDEVASQTEYSWVFFPAFEFGNESPAGGFGNALLTKLPILSAHQWYLVSTGKPYDGTEDSEPRSVLLMKLKLEDDSCWIGSTHLPRGNPEARTQAMRRLSAIISKLAGRWLICGDFNAPPSSWPHEEWPFIEFPGSAQPTYPAEQPTEPIDYCIASPGTILTARVLPVAGSDHLPLYVVAKPGDT